MSDILHIAEIPHESGAVRYRYARVMSADGTRWIRHGLFVEYSEAGAVVAEGSYANGNEDGLWREFHPSGNLAAEGHYRAGREAGVWHFWAPDGSQEPDVDYQPDAAHG